MLLNENQFSFFPIKFFDLQSQILQSFNVLTAGMQKKHFDTNEVTLRSEMADDGITKVFVILFRIKDYFLSSVFGLLKIFIFVMFGVGTV